MVQGFLLAQGSCTTIQMVSQVEHGLDQVVPMAPIHSHGYQVELVIIIQLNLLITKQISVDFITFIIPMEPQLQIVLLKKETFFVSLGFCRKQGNIFTSPADGRCNIFSSVLQCVCESIRLHSTFRPKTQHTDKGQSYLEPV